MKDVFQQAFRLREYPMFQSYCAAYNIDHEDPRELEYWSAASHFAEETPAEDAGMDLTETEHVLLRLITAAPVSLYAKALLETRQIKGPARNSYRHVAVRFNRLLYETGLRVPGISVAALSTCFEHVTAIAIPHTSDRFIPGIYEEIGRTVNGVRHEIAMEEILDAAGYTCHKSTERGDLRGVDSIVSGGALPIPVDFKAGISTEMTYVPEGGYYHIRDNGIVRLASLVTAPDFGDSMHVNKDTIAQKVPLAQTLLAAIIGKLSNPPPERI